MRIKTRILPEGSGYFDKVQYGSGMVTKEPSDKLIGQRRSAEIRAEYITELFAFQLGDKNKDGSFSVLGHKRIFFRIGSEGKKFEIKISDLDGLLFTYPDWWFNVRLSNTEPLLRLNLEAKNKELMEEKLGEIKRIIENY